MSTTVCQQQGLQSRFSLWHIESRVMGFELSLSSRCTLRPPPPKNSGLELSFNTLQFTTHNQKCEIEHENSKSTKINEGFGGWSFLEALSDSTKQSVKKQNEEQVYVHPLVKRSKSMLSEKSLEMCTESLGSETGSNISEENGDQLITEKSPTPRMVPCFTLRNKSSIISNLPPPLTTIRGGSGGGVRVKSERENGRLVIKATCFETPQSCFKAERKDGRLMLHFNNHEDYDDENDYDYNYDYDYDYNIDDEFDDENFGDEVEAGNFFSRAIRGCKEEGDGGRNTERHNWESFWVATS